MLIYYTYILKHPCALLSPVDSVGRVGQTGGWEVTDEFVVLMQMAGDYDLNSWVQDFVTALRVVDFLSFLVECFAWQELIVDELGS